MPRIRKWREVLKKVNLLGFLDTQNGLDTVLLEKGGKSFRGSVPAPCDRKSLLLKKMLRYTSWMRQLPILMWKVKN